MTSTTTPPPTSKATSGGATTNRHRTVHLRREGSTFGFTVRHLIVVTPDDVDCKANEVGLTEPMDTLYVKNVKRDSLARQVGLRKNDRILEVNDKLVTGCSYSEVMALINHCGSNLKLLVIGREDDYNNSYPTSPKQSSHSASLASASIPENTRPKDRADQRRATLPTTSMTSNPSPTHVRKVSPLTSARRKSSPQNKSPSRNQRRCREDTDWLRSSASPTRTTSASPEKTAAAGVTLTAGHYVAANRRRLKENQEKKCYQRSYTTSSIIDSSTTSATNGYPSKLGSIVGDYGLAISHRGNIKLRSDAITASSSSTPTTPASCSSTTPSQHSRAAHLASKSSTELGVAPTGDGLTPKTSVNIVSERLRKFESADNIGGTSSSISASSSPFTPRYGCESVQARTAKYEHLTERRRSSCDPANGTINIYFRGESPQPSVLLRKSVDRDPKKITPQRSCPHLNDADTITPDSDSKDTKLSRRTSYLIATRQTQSDSEDVMVSPMITSTPELDVEGINTTPNQNDKNQYRKLKSFFGEKNPNNEVVTKTKPLEEHIGALSMKISMIEGKRSTLRSWKQVWGVIKNHEFYFFREGEKSAQFIHIKNCSVDISVEYAKRKKNVFKLQTTEDNEYLFVVEEYKDMIQWINAINLHGVTGKDRLLEDKIPLISESSNSYSPPPSLLSINEKTSITASLSTSALPLSSVSASSAASPSSVSIVSAPGMAGGTKTSLLTKKTSKSSATLGYGFPINYNRPKDNASKENSWKGRLGRKFKRYGSSNADSPGANQTLTSAISLDATTTSSCVADYNNTFGIPLECAPMSQFFACVPLIVTLCVEIVEQKGLQNQGIYRVPGNTGAVNALIDVINNSEKIDDYNMSTDPRWSDVNVVSSLLKAFFRKLADPLITGEHYDAIIAANRIEDGEKRMLKIKKELLLLPDHNFETFHYLALHLERIANKGDINKMDSRNLAIVFGPTLIRTKDDSMVTMVRDMSDQCKIIETIIQQVEWFFSSWDEDYHVPVDEASVGVTPLSGMNEELLNKARHLEGGKSDSNPKDIISSMLHSAQKKIRANIDKSKDRSRDSIETDLPDIEPESFSFFNEKDTHKEADKHKDLHKQQISKPIPINTTSSSSTLKPKEHANLVSEVTPSITCSMTLQHVPKKPPRIHGEGVTSPKITRYPAITATIQSAVESLAQFDAPKTIHRRRYSIAELAELETPFPPNNCKKSPKGSKKYSKSKTFDSSDGSMNVDEYTEAIRQTDRLYQTPLASNTGEGDGDSHSGGSSSDLCDRLQSGAKVADTDADTQRRHTLGCETDDIARSFSPSDRPFDPSLRPH